MDGIQHNLDAQIADLNSADLEGLRRYWKSALAKPFPQHLSRQMLVCILAYRLQASLHGDLSQDHRKYLGAVARAAAQGPGAAIPKHGHDTKRFKAGTVLVREHNGVEHRVTATAEGFAWEGGTYSSLSAVARAITGTNWNGHRFFGLSGSTEQ